MVDEQHRAKRGVAILAAALAQTINETDPTFRQRFLDRLEAAYQHVRDDPTYFGGDTVDEMDLLSWTREYLTGFSWSKGQHEPFLHDYKPKL